MSVKNSKIEESAVVTISVRFLAMSFIVASIAAIVGYAVLLTEMKSRITDNKIKITELSTEVKHLKEFQAEVTKCIESEFGTKINAVERVQAVENKRIEQKSDLKDNPIREINTLQNNSTREVFNEKLGNVKLSTLLRIKNVQDASKKQFYDSKNTSKVNEIRFISFNQNFR